MVTKSFQNRRIKKIWQKTSTFLLREKKVLRIYGAAGFWSREEFWFETKKLLKQPTVVKVSVCFVTFVVSVEIQSLWKIGHVRKGNDACERYRTQSYVVLAIISRYLRNYVRYSRRRKNRRVTFEHIPSSSRTSNDGFRSNYGRSITCTCLVALHADLLLSTFSFIGKNFRPQRSNVARGFKLLNFDLKALNNQGDQ